MLMAMSTTVEALDGVLVIATGDIVGIDRNDDGLTVDLTFVGADVVVAVGLLSSTRTGVLVGGLLSLLLVGVTTLTGNRTVEIIGLRTGPRAVMGDGCRGDTAVGGCTGCVGVRTGVVRRTGVGVGATSTSISVG